MPHEMIRLKPGVNLMDTPVLNEAGVSSCEAIRYVFDPKLGGLIQKLGGWTKFYGASLAAIARALWAWQDLNEVPHLAFGTENIGVTGHAQLGVISGSMLQDITPRSIADNVTPAASTTSGSPVVTITDATTTGITSFDTVYILTHISVGGVILFGLYPCITHLTTSYQVVATDVLGEPWPASSTTTTTAVASFTTTSGSNVVTVVLPNHGYSAGSDYPVLVSTTVGGVTLYGDYVVQSVVDANTFTILAAQNASSGATGSINGGNAAFIYSIGIGALPRGSGFGIGGFGRGGFGVGSGITPTTGTQIAATDWTLDNWGEILLASPINGTLLQPIYAWDPTSGAPFATILSYGPPTCDGFFVAMPERQIVAWGTTVTGIPDPLLIRWCDINNPNVWIGQTTNQAGEFRLTRGSKIVGGIQGPQQGLIWTDLGLWSMQYINLPDIYGFNEIGQGCGLISRKGACAFGGAVYWMGVNQFFSLTAASETSPGGVQPMACSVWSEVFDQLDRSNLHKIRVAVNSMFNEVAWYYPTLSSGGEVGAYVKYNTQLGVWDYGVIARSAWVDQSVVGPPVGFDPTRLLLYQHETSNDADGAALVSNFTTGYSVLGEGEYKAFVDQLWPDAQYGMRGQPQTATISVSVLSADFPSDTPGVDGPFAFTATSTYATPRTRARLMAFQIGSSDVGSFWRMGGMRYRYEPDGKF